jgi:hypothetical protein
MQTVQIAGQPVEVFEHPEVGYVLSSQCGAQSDGCAYDTPDRSRAAAPPWLDALLKDQEALWSSGQPGHVDAILASDGWWWRVVQPYRYGLSD